MMLKLNAGFSRKVGEPNFGSRGASVNVELELDSNLVRDSQALCSHIRNHTARPESHIIWLHPVCGQLYRDLRFPD